ncbi:MAG: FtsW/RodA/SpoVE family cell cycle protein [Vampirovibrionales bacterium]
MMSTRPPFQGYGTLPPSSSSDWLDEASIHDALYGVTRGHQGYDTSIPVSAQIPEEDAPDSYAWVKVPISKRSVPRMNQARKKVSLMGQPSHASSKGFASRLISRMTQVSLPMLSSPSRRVSLPVSLPQAVSSRYCAVKHSIQRQIQQAILPAIGTPLRSRQRSPLRKSAVMTTAPYHVASHRVRPVSAFTHTSAMVPEMSTRVPDFVALPRPTTNVPFFRWMDGTLLSLVFLLIGIGLITLASASTRLSLIEAGHGFTYLLKQGFYTCIGIALMYFVATRSLAWVRRLTWGVALFTLVLLFATLVAGKTANGAERWLMVGPFQVQTSEFAKIAVVMLLADAMALPAHDMRKNTRLLFALIASIVMIGLVFKQPNLSVTLILAGVMASMYWMNGLSTLFFMVGLPVGAAFVWQKIVSTPYQWARIQGWIYAAEHPAKEGYNLIQSLKAICYGGFWGRGLGGSIHKLGFLPFQHTDFIFSVFCEEFGWIGAMLLIAILLGLFFRGAMIAWQTQKMYAKYLAAGIVVVLFLQTWVNLAVTTGTMPVTGVTLPLVSYGGTSVVITLMMFGVLFLVARQPIESSFSSSQEEDGSVTRIHPEYRGSGV